ncbi:hypothetical protein AAFC00_004402 [Neodothiora populina]|uniref:Rhodopsin domain-containing protein n=1 Tax=Neodothiora populina TaxID=2781224 RepID=A0ABR3PPI5_9PEZI
MDLSNDSEEVTASQEANEIVLLKLSFASNYFYDTGMYFPKATLLALYFKLIPVTMPHLRRFLYFVTAFTLSCAITTCLLDTFFCHHVPDNWSLKEGACSTFNSLLVFQIDWALNFSSDILIFTLPFPLLRHLHLKRKQLYGLIVTFALGVITIMVNLGRFISIDIGSGWNGVYAWSMAEMAVAIIVVSLPALKPLLGRHANRTTPGSRSRSNGYYSGGSRHMLSSHGGFRNMDPPVDDTASDVELNCNHDMHAIYKTEEVNVSSRPIDSTSRTDCAARVWVDDKSRFQSD